MKKWYHLVFVGICVVVLGVLLSAPKVTTPRLPADANHQDPRNYARCPQCHGADSPVPMPTEGEKVHFLPDGSLRTEFVKCYMCHRVQES
ncbi:MAG: hypothetical protein SCH98_18210 [Deferrisomatales bacterium]|nr:hypothetical protein [Deferrisomatales bacterium]